MRIGVIQAASQREKNNTLYQCVLNAVAKNGRDDAVVNYGVFAGESVSFSYVETALNVSLLLQVARWTSPSPAARPGRG